jgi:hypothetical protein
MVMDSSVQFMGIRRKNMPSIPRGANSADLAAARAGKSIASQPSRGAVNIPGKRPEPVTQQQLQAARQGKSIRK